MSAKKKTGKLNMAKYQQLLSNGYVRIYYLVILLVCLEFFVIKSLKNSTKFYFHFLRLKE